jgi:AraC family transcriptional regulator
MDTIKAVQFMQDYIQEHSQDMDFSIEKMCRDVGYSRRHAERLFKGCLGSTLQEYVNAVCLTQSAAELQETEKSIVEIAMNSHFQTHEGFTRSFRKRFSVTPSEYREKRMAIPLFVSYPISQYAALLQYKEDVEMNNDMVLCMVTPQERPKRKLIYLTSRKAGDYLSYCEEVGCEWEGLLNSIPEKWDTAALIELPPYLVEEGGSPVAAGVEVPLDYAKELPASYRVAELPECTMLYFQSAPYEKEEDFCQAIENTYAAIGKYDPERYGYRFAYDLAPSFNFGADAATGARLAVPAVRLH